MSATNIFTLPASSIGPALEHPQVQVMNFLNEIAMRYPDAISFASGRPPQELFDVESALAHLHHWLEASSPNGTDIQATFRSLMQYGRTAGVIHEEIARLLRHDDAVHVDGGDVLVTAGAQEAMCIVLRTLCARPDDVALVVDPAYIGMSAAARVLGIDIEAVSADDRGIDMEGLTRLCAGLRAGGRRARLLYLSPDFANPTGTCMPIERRRELLAFAAAHDLVLVEDHAYNYFRYDGEPQPPLLAMAPEAPVILIGSFSKSVFPGVRMGYAATRLRVERDGRLHRLTDEMTKVKSLLSVNTSPLCQAVVGGLLQASGGSLKQHVEPMRRALRARRDAMIDALVRHFPADADGARDVSWNRPAGGFFLTLRLPFEVDDADLEMSARVHRVIWTPMSYFHVGPARRDVIRLSFSYGTAEEIDAGVRGLADMVRSRRQASEEADPVSASRQPVGADA
jgi:(S)-3,5-dihydroxyphenylglycine transaminase